MSVESSLRINDAMTRPIQNITNSMNLMISTMQKMQSATSKNVNVDKTLTAAKRQLASAEAEIKAAIDQAEKSQQKFNRAVDKGEEKVAGLKRMAGGLATIYAAIKGGEQLLSATVGGAFEQQKMKDMFVARTGSEQIGGAMFDKFKQDALKAGMDVSESLKGTLSFFSTTQDVNKLTELNRITQQLAAFDSAGNGIDGAAFALKEAMSGDIVSLAERFNMSKTDIRAFKIDELGKAGDMEGFIKAFDQLLDKQKMGKEAFETMLKSPAKQLEILQNNVKSMFADAGSGAMASLLPLIKLLNEAFQEGKFQPFFAALNAALGVLSELLSIVVQGALWLWDVVVTYWPEITAMLIAWGATYLPGLIAKLWATIPPILAQAAAWLAANWPILLVIALVGILIYVLRQMGVTTDQMVGAVVGAFYMMFAIIYNKIALVWNLIISVAEFIANIFVDPVYAVKKLFYDMAMAFLEHIYNMMRSAEDFAGSFMKVIIESVNGVLKSFNWLADKVNSLFGKEIMGQAELFDEENVNAMSDKVKEIMDNLEEPTSDKDVFDFSDLKMDEMNYKDTYDKGYDAGSGFAKGMGDLFGGLDDLGKIPPGGVDPDKNNVGEVGKVKKVEDTVDISSEDLRIMRDLAEMKSIQNFVTLTPTVQVTTGDINQTADVDSVIDRIVEVATKDIASSAERVFE